MIERTGAVLLRRHPAGVPTPADFEWADCPLGELAEGEVLVAVDYLSLDPYLRGVISGRHLGHKVELGAVLPGTAVGTVIASRSAAVPVGRCVIGELGWREHARVAASALQPVLVPSGVSPSTALGVLGMPGLTAYIGVRDLARPAAGQCFVVSAASGPVGATAGQLAKRAGARVVGVAGGAAKCAYVVEQLGFDACVDYKLPDFVDALRAACPARIDAYFDNVGGAVLDACIQHLALHARVVLCGLIDQYNLEQRPPGPNLGPVIAARASLHGLVVYDHFARMPEMLGELGPLVAAGELRYREDISVGLRQAPEAFCRLMRGENFGKTLVRLR